MDTILHMIFQMYFFLMKIIVFWLFILLRFISQGPVSI